LSEREASLLDLESSERANSVPSQAEGREHGIETSPGHLGGNLTTQGVDLLSLPIEIVVV
jgi:MOSC domain-containing protein YiiM